MDPTWNQDAADPTQLKLGVELAQVAGAMGGVALAVVADQTGSG